MKRVLIGYEKNRKKRVYILQRRRWLFLWVTIGIYQKRDKAFNKYFRD